MTISLKTFRPLNPVSVRIRGVELSIRAMTAAECNAIRESLPLPDGDSAAVRERVFELRYQAIAGVAANIANKAGETWDPTRSRAWVVGYIMELANTLTRIEIDRLYSAAEKAAGCELDPAGAGGSAPEPVE